MGKKCEFFGRCEWQSSDSVTCTKNAGRYYSYDRYPGCFRANRLKADNPDISEADESHTKAQS